MKPQKKLLAVALLLFAFLSYSQETVISSGRLSINIFQDATGIYVSSIQDNGTEILNDATSSNFFSLFLKNLQTDTDYVLNSQTGWSNVQVIDNTDNAIVQLTNPTDDVYPDTLSATITISTDDSKSTWDLSVTGIGSNYSLMDVIFPNINIAAPGNDTFLYPLYSGRLTPDPASGIDYYDDAEDGTDDIVGLYTRGWGTTMQFMSYYNDNYGLYFGFHDETATPKHFRVRNLLSGVEVGCKYKIADKTLAGNDWEVPGNFALDLFDGNWYEAALLYKEWVSSEADYWPQDSAEREIRQHTVGDLGIWLSSYITDATVPEMQNYIQTATDFFDVPVGVHIYEWNYNEHDHFYPNYFLEQTGLDILISNVQNNNAVIMPYINGRMWDTGIGGDDPGDEEAQTYFVNEGLVAATKDSNGNYIQDYPFEQNEFAIMCPTQTSWQNVLIDAADQITGEDRLGSKALYIDMIAASAAAECMDANHNHTLGGGSFWRDGYKEMLENMHTTIPVDRFITAEGGCDYIADVVDAFMIQGWTTDHQVPAWQAVYTGKVQLFGTKTGGSHYGDQQFYSKLGQGFIYGVQTGRQFIWLAINPNQNDNQLMAANYVKSLSRMRYKLKDFMSYGEMKKPIQAIGDIPEITYQVHDWGGHHGYTNVTYPILQGSVWQNDNEVVVVFANTRIQSPAGTNGGEIPFSFDFNAADYGLQGNITKQRITPTYNGNVESVDPNFTETTFLSNLGLVAYKITGENNQAVDEENLEKMILFPNPTNDTFRIKGISEEIIQLQMYNSFGQKVDAFIKAKDIDIPHLSKGVYLVSVETKKNTYIAKLIKD